MNLSTFLLACLGQLFLFLGTFFGILIITATPIYQIPARLRALRDKALGRTAVDADAEPAAAPGPVAREPRPRALP